MQKFKTTKRDQKSRHFIKIIIDINRRKGAKTVNEAKEQSNKILKLRQKENFKTKGDKKDKTDNDETKRKRTKDKKKVQLSEGQKTQTKNEQNRQKRPKDKRIREKNRKVRR